MSGHGMRAVEWGYSLSGDSRGRDLSGHREKEIRGEAYRLETAEGLVRARKKKKDRARGTHSLERGEGGAWSGHGKKVTE